ncbi:archaeal nucleolar protein-like [Haloarcula marismortui ATCC 43049]|jgi:nucleolar protein 56|uniref:Archaeal nucleolar protein-like n=1 Tax=Haloarcula marismortui (strain ATCC 43049 / DSM 3752 / JCM 8966 / VKM B-1809) TaxID=272569 RepID=Q5V3Q7_HALMA|nr:NOP5/NOP56 family protein [Haloarcula marismortui]AAV45845.1 archaeal nucleolar protein-like [Haloarcula marismortui ATCC 43049]QCP90618.1 NOP58 family protein [Haloarcula marismortui ATCC 43049]
MSNGWFAGLDPDDDAAAVEQIEAGRADTPEDWPQQAVEAGFADDEAAYYDRLHEVTMAATSAAVAEQEGADDQQLVHAVRAMADCERTANELAERVAEWGGSRHGDSGSGVEYARSLADREDEDEGDRALRSLAEQTAALADEADSIRAYIERTAPAVAPNLSMLAGPVLAARLISLAGGLEALAKKPSGTVQVLGAEDALFAHLKGSAPSPKHGVIFTHEYVRGTRREDRGSAARAFAGKLSIAARIDHYSGDRRPDLQVELDERIERIQARAEEGDDE